MKGQENPAELLVMCVVVIVLSLLGVIGSISRDLFRSLDALLLLFVSLLMLLIFTLLLVSLARKQGWIGKHPKDDNPAGAPAGK